MARLKEYGRIITGNTPPSSIPEYYVSNDICFVKPSDFSSNDVTIIEDSEYYISEAARQCARMIPEGSILVTCIGTVGKVGIAKKEMAFNQQINAIIPGNDVDASCLAYSLLYHADRIKAIANAPVVPIINKNAFSDIDIPLPDLPTQRRIAATLDKVSEGIDLCRKMLGDLDEVVKARFVEMFGDMLLNTMKLQEQELYMVADIVSGITKGRKIISGDLKEVPYMAVSNVKEGYIDWTTVKTIEATQDEIDQYRLMPNDVLMTEGGDPDKLGRGAIIKEPPQNCIHQNHIFRVRLSNAVLPEYFAEYLQHQKAKRYFLGCAKQTTGIASINMRQLRALPVLVPPLNQQRIFAEHVAKVQETKRMVQNCLEGLEVLKKALMQKYFG